MVIPSEEDIDVDTLDEGLDSADIEAKSELDGDELENGLDELE
jgi:hypothetical protein